MKSKLKIIKHLHNHLEVKLINKGLNNQLLFLNLNIKKNYNLN